MGAHTHRTLPYDYDFVGHLGRYLAGRGGQRLAGGLAGFRRDAPCLTDVRAVDELDHAGAGICTIGFARSVAAGGDDQLTVHRHLATRKNLQLPECIRLQTERKDINPQLTRSGDFVDILPARPG